MTKHRKGRSSLPATPAPPTAVVAGRGLRESDLIALIAIAVVAVLTWLARTALNPDGVSYLDLAGRLASGDRSSFVQGYWSPLYPALIAATAPLTGAAPLARLAAAHTINGLAALGMIALVWWWGRGSDRPYLARALIAATLVCSSGLPRVEGVTPDVLLLGVLTWLGYELLVHRGERWALTGLLLGAAFLTKTSAWPWVLVAVPLRLWGSRDPSGRRDVYRSSLTCAAVMLAWVAPLSFRAGQFTAGSAARLNYCWYIDACDSRSPDTHLGRHTAYHEVNVDATRHIVWAEFTDADRWTYAPWSDPTAWEAGVRTRTSSAPTPWQLISYWGRQAARSFGLWLLPLFAGVLVPWIVAHWRPGTWRRFVDEERASLVVVLLGLAGIGQFILIHSEPRLIAPYGLFLALGVLHGVTPRTDGPERRSRWRLQGASILGLVVASGFTVTKLREGVDSGPRIAHAIETLAADDAEVRSAGLSQARIVVIGPAIPVEAVAFLSGAHIVAQLLPGGVGTLSSLPSDQQRRFFAENFGALAQVAWVTTSDGGFTRIAVPSMDPRPDAAPSGPGR